MAPLRSGCDAERAIDELRLANKSAFGSHRICLLRTMFMASYAADSQASRGLSLAWQYPGASNVGPWWERVPRGRLDAVMRKNL